MSKDVANEIVKLATKYQDDSGVYVFNEKVYCKHPNTSDDDFIKNIVQDNVKKCIELVFESKNSVGYELDGRGPFLNEINHENYENNIDITPFSFNHDTFDDWTSHCEKLGWNIDCYRKCKHQKIGCVCETQSINQKPNIDIHIEGDNDNDSDCSCDSADEDNHVCGGTCKYCDQPWNICRGKKCKCVVCGDFNYICYQNECEKCGDFLCSCQCKKCKGKLLCAYLFVVLYKLIASFRESLL